MNTCGNCRNYIKRPFNEDICSKTGKVVGWLWVRDCFELRNNETTMEEIKTKVCKECGRELPLEQFAKSVKSSDGHLHICRECKGKKQHEAMEKYKARMRGEDAPVSGVAHTDEFIKQDDLSLFGDQILVDELRFRGYDVKCTKTIEL